MVELPAGISVATVVSALGATAPVGIALHLIDACSNKQQCRCSLKHEQHQLQLHLHECCMCMVACSPAGAG